MAEGGRVRTLGRRHGTLGERVSLAAEGSTCDHSTPPAVLRDESRRTDLDLVSDLAHSLDGLALRVFKRPVLAPQARDDGALLAAADGQKERRSASDFDFGVDMRTRPRSRQ